MTQVDEDSIPFPLHLLAFLFSSLQNYEQSSSLPLLNYKQFYSSSVQIYDQGVDLFQENCQAQFQLASLVVSWIELALNLIITTPTHPGK